MIFPRTELPEWATKIKRTLDSGRSIIITHFNIDDELIVDGKPRRVKDLAIEATGAKRFVSFSLSGWEFDSDESEILFRTMYDLNAPPEHPGEPPIIDGDDPRSLERAARYGQRLEDYEKWVNGRAEGRSVKELLPPIPFDPIHPVVTCILDTAIRDKRTYNDEGKPDPEGLVTVQEFAVVIDYAHTIIPATEKGSRNVEERTLEVYLTKWSEVSDIPTTLVFARSLVDINHELYGRGANVATVNVPYPNETQRKDFLQDLKRVTNVRVEGTDVETLARISSGMSNRHLRALVSECTVEGKPVTLDLMLSYKHDVVNDELAGLVEFVTPTNGFECVGGLEHVKNELNEITEAIRDGLDWLVPMGILLTGPPGTGKTLIAEAFAKQVGFNFIRLKNQKSKWLGETEGNIQKAMEVAISLAPTVIFIDEIDQQSGQRSGYDGDGGASSFIFSTILKTMGDTNLRAKVMWIAATNRPDMMDTAMKRPGRFDIRIPLLYPSAEERMQIFQAVARRYDLSLDRDVNLEYLATETEGYNGADIEAIMLLSARFAYKDGRGKVIGTTHILDAIADYLPQSDEKNVQSMTETAVKESSSLRLVPEPYRSAIKAQKEKVKKAKVKEV